MASKDFYVHLNARANLAVGFGTATPTWGNAQVQFKGTDNDIATRLLALTNFADEAILTVKNNKYVGINNDAPAANLDVAGTMKFVDGNQAVNKVLVSDASGNATWGNVDLSVINESSVTVAAASYNAGDTSIIYVDTTSNAVIINLPAAASSAGKSYIIKKITGGSNYVTIDANASESIDGDPEVILYVQYDTLKLNCNGTEWFIIS